MLNVKIEDTRTLETAIKDVTRFAGGAHDLPILQSIHIENLQNGLQLTATNLTESVSYVLNTSQVFEEGSFCINKDSLKKIGMLAKGNDAITLKQTEKGVELQLSDAPTFGAVLETLPTDEFPMLPEVDIDDVTTDFILSADCIKSLKEIAKYVSKGAYSDDLQAIHFQTQNSDGGEALGVSALTPKGLDSGSRPTSPPSAGVLYALACNGKIVASAELHNCVDMDIAIAIPTDTFKKACQLATGPLGKAMWYVRRTDKGIVSVQIKDTCVMSKEGEFSADLFETHAKITRRFDAELSIATAALVNALKPLTKVFSKDKRATNLLTLETDGDTVSLIAECYETGGYWIESECRYVHTNDCVAEQRHIFRAGEVDRIGQAFRLHLDWKTFTEQIKALSKSKAHWIDIACQQDARNDHGEPIATPMRLSVAGNPQTPSYLVQTFDADAKKVRG